MRNVAQKLSPLAGEEKWEWVCVLACEKCVRVCVRKTLCGPLGPKEHPCTFLQLPTPPLQSLPSLDFRPHPKCVSAA